MCGILGVVKQAEAQLPDKKIRPLLDELFRLAYSRGKEASGFARLASCTLQIYKTNQSAKALIKSRAYRIGLKNTAGDFAMIGHSRLVTDGAAARNANNQPFSKKGIVGVHNGIIVNKKELWKKYNDEKSESDLDSELIPTLVGRFMAKGSGVIQAIQKFYREIYGMTNIALLVPESKSMILATNSGALYALQSKDDKVLIFASERIMLERVVKTVGLKKWFDAKKIVHLLPGQIREVPLGFGDWSIQDISAKDKGGPEKPKAFKVSQEFLEHFERCQRQIHKLRRCQKCLLPQIFPFIDYNAEGVCNFCRDYRKLQFKGTEAFAQKMEPYRRVDGKPDCVVSFSGGRDSCFSLHYIKKVLGLNPIAYSYDWGMVTDLARRNQARLCDRLGVEHIYISADITKKRKNIQRNVLAWLKRPHLGTIPLFMAGDKLYFYYANKLRRDYGIDALIMGDNMLESTNFKTGFCGIQPVFSREKNYHIPLSGKLKMLGFYGKECLLNPRYLNRSVLDTAKGFLSYYFMPHNFINIFDYIEWQQPMIEKILFDEYDWEISPHTSTTWRIGDGTAAFYNYIYYTVAGFTENDTFRSNQIREGHITREEGLKKASEENKAQWGNIKWYCDTIDIDFDQTIKTINQIPKCYSQ